MAVRLLNSKTLSVAAKVLGAATGVAVLYDSHVNGKEKAFVVDSEESADRFSSQYSQYITSDKESATLCKLKKFWYDSQQNLQALHIFSKLKGYISGAGNTILNAVPLIGLSAVALLTKSKSKLGIAAGALLALNGLKTLLYDVMGIGVKKNKID